MPIIKVPLDLRSEFLADPENFIRDKCCIPVDAISPFFKRKDVIFTAFDYKGENPFDEDTLKFRPGFRAENADKRRYMHIDLSLNKDAVGISCAHSPYFVRSAIESTNSGASTMVPYVKFDFVGRIVCVKGEEIILGQIEDIIFELSKLGFFIGLITFDRFQSARSMQLLREHGYVCANLSIDRTAFKVIVDPKGRDNIRRESTDRQYSMAAQEFKEAVYRRGISIPYHKVLEEEMKTVEFDAKSGTVVKRQNKTDDIFQSVSGSVFNLINNERYAAVETTEEIEYRSDNYYQDLGANELNRPRMDINQEEFTIEDDFYNDYGD